MDEQFLHSDDHPVDAETRVAGRTDHKDELRLWLRLLTLTTMIENEIRRRLRTGFDVTLPRFDLMAQLEKAPEGLTLGALSKHMMVSAGNVTGLVDRLVQDGLLERRAAPGDRRSALVRLTPEGHDGFVRMADAHGDWMGTFFADLNDEDIETLMRLLGKAKGSVRKALAAADNGSKPEGRA